jgi:hypothetical protein
MLWLLGKRLAAAPYPLPTNGPPWLWPGIQYSPDGSVPFDSHLGWLLRPAPQGRCCYGCHDMTMLCGWRRCSALHNSLIVLALCL